MDLASLIHLTILDLEICLICVMIIQDIIINNGNEIVTGSDYLGSYIFI